MSFSSHSNNSSVSLGAASEAASNASSISLGVWPETNLPLEFEADDEAAESDSVPDSEPEDIDPTLPGFLERAARALAEQEVYAAASAAMNEKIQQLRQIAEEDLRECMDQYPTMAVLHHANHERRVQRIELDCAREAGPAANLHIHLLRVNRILDGLYVPPIEEVVMELD
ncbi:hypothetical protein RSOL_031450, partial [Rhizoctonia solani AG-3 Rhs1AP]